jgi:tRNA modification GTPase
MDEFDVIGGCLTASGVGGLHVFRVEGAGVPSLLGRVFRSRGEEADHASLRYGHLIDGDEILDEVVVALDRGKRRAEISTHGGQSLKVAVEALLCRAGVRLVDQATLRDREVASAVAREAIEGLGRTRAVQGLLFFLSVLEGRLEAEVRGLVATLENLDGAEPHAQVVPSVRRRLRTLLARCRFGRAFVDPPRILLAGPPNAGKSTLANRLLGWERWIVSEEPGTTRDLVVEELELGGYPFRLLDSAGVRDAVDPIEGMGVARTRVALRDADIVVLVVDGTEPIAAWPAWADLLCSSREVVLCLNKADLPTAVSAESMARQLGRPVIQVSAREGTGLEDLTTVLLYRSPFRGPARREIATPFTMRQEACLLRAHEALPSSVDAARAALAEMLEP